MDMWAKSLVCILIYCLQKGNAVTNSNSRIIGGYAAYQGQWEFHVAIDVQTGTSKFHCGGALISNQWILTSGHCVNGAILFTIQLGSNNLVEDDPESLILATSTYYLHPDFNPDAIENDIALIELRLPITQTMYIRPIELPTADITGPTIVITMGFGQTSDSNTTLPNYLRYVVISSIENDECKIYYGNQINDNMICAIGSYNEGTCVGDTGGPLVWIGSVPDSLAGISSFISSNGCESTNPSGFTRVYPYLDWINEVINNATSS